MGTSVVVDKAGAVVDAAGKEVAVHDTVEDAVALDQLLFGCLTFVSSVLHKLFKSSNFTAKPIGESTEGHLAQVLRTHSTEHREIMMGHRD